jgi:hypothetical protein
MLRAVPISSTAECSATQEVSNARRRRFRLFVEPRHAGFIEAPLIGAAQRPAKEM